jgi:hypothetical protein
MVEHHTDSKLPLQPVLNGDACNVSGRSYLAAFNTSSKAQISNFKTKESELTHHFLLVDLAMIG